MRGRIGSLMNHGSIIGRTTTVVSSSFCCAFSSSSSSSSSSSGGDGDNDGGGSGRGSGRGSPNSPSYNFVAPTTDSNDDQFSLRGRGHGHGHGHDRGKPLPSSPFNSFVAPDAPPLPHQPGLSRGRGGPIHHPATEPKRPIFLTKDESTGATSEADFVASEPRRSIGEKNLPHTLFNPLPATATATGRGKSDRKPLSDTRVMEENRHLRPRQPPHAAGDARAGERPQKGNVAPPETATPRPKLSREEAIKKAVGILSKGDDVRDGGLTDAGGGRRRRGTKSKDDSDDEDAEEDDTDDEAFIGNDADGEKFAQKLGPELMSELAEAFEDMSVDVLPDPELDEHTEAFDTNLKIELEPEYLMGDFETNPDLHENPPIPLAEALEKMKPFLMAYEGIESQEEWEEVIKDTMERVPLLKEIVDHYCGPDRVTAKQQREELERVAKTIPPNVPNSVKRFTDSAVLSLQSNPGWGFHRKWQFMDKLVDEVSKSHK